MTSSAPRSVDPDSSRATSDKPIRDELFSVERLEQEAGALAASHHVTLAPRVARNVTRELRDNGTALRAAYRDIGQAVREELTITAAAEWLIDNFYVVEEQMVQIRRDLPPGFYRQLPKLSDGPFAGYPRVFALAWDLIAHTDSRIELAVLARFLRAYQQVEPLTIGELWAIAITLRIVLVENLRRLADGLVRRLEGRREAEFLSDRLLAGDAADKRSLDSLLHRYEAEPLPPAFAVQLMQRLHDHDPKVTPTLAWLDRQLDAAGTSVERITLEEHQRQGATNITIRNVITSMRLISAANWMELFESVSLVDAALAEGNALFTTMDFPSRDHYRRAVEELARGSGRTELDVARRATAAAHRPETASARERDPGYYLIARGRPRFAAEIGFRQSWRARIGHLSLSGYLGILLAVTLAAIVLAIAATAEAGSRGTTLLWLALLALLPAFDAAVTLVTRAVTAIVIPNILPALELREGVSATLRSLVVIPMMLSSDTAIAEEIERLEVHYLANGDGDLRFALLSDWMDSASETAPDDDRLFAAAATGIARLNRRYGRIGEDDRFLLLHRRRLWNAGEGKWMGWERKRGKLHELNRLLRGATDTTFLALPGGHTVPPTGVRYVVTVDADTLLPRGTVLRLVGKMAHPLNQPMLDPRTGIVVEGHALLQPRVTPALPTEREGSPFQRAYSNAGGIDPYAFPVSDVYQDLFDEGSYVGKGIYDIDFFESGLDRRIRENTVLSHDLLEGSFVRAALVSDIEVVEEYPARYEVAAARHHRWIRGDWQLLPWVLGIATDAEGRRARSRVPPIGRWKMIDNLRRSLSAPAALLAFLLGWTLPRGPALVWTGFVFLTIALPTLLPLLLASVTRWFGVPNRRQVRAIGEDLLIASAQIAFLITFLPHQAWLTIDALTRTLYRLKTRRHLLEWVTAAQSAEAPGAGRRGFHRQLAGAVVFAVIAALALAAFGRGAGWIAVPFLCLWAVSPALARWASQPIAPAGSRPIANADARRLRLAARRTWRFFERFVTSEDHMLPPDNFQEDPQPIIAHRTSPTNMGLYFLSLAAARDFAWIGNLDLVDRIEATLATMARLERFRGHFYNWYDTSDLRPLDPKYISTVDSGNLAGHLLTLSNIAREMVEAPIANPQALTGIADAVALAAQALREGGVETMDGELLSQLDAALTMLAAGCRAAPMTPAALMESLTGLAAPTDRLVDIATALHARHSGEAMSEILAWAQAARAAVQSHLRDARAFMPWAGVTPLSATIPGLANLPELCIAGGLTAASPDNDTMLRRVGEEAARLRNRLIALADRTHKIVETMAFDFLFDPDRQLFSIGYRVTDGSLDPNYYDLLASEARLTSFLAIAKGDAPTKHWFKLGRSLTPLGWTAALQSWSGSMFEYLMPSLVMREPAGSLLEDTNRLIVKRQRDYGNRLGIPWGISESAYNLRDLELTYQYSAFGVPGLGLKRGLGDNQVIAPYATALAAMVDPAAAASNLRQLEAAGGRGRYGWYEALDYTPARVPVGADHAVIRAYMAHHQGMSLVAIDNALHDGIMRNRFHAEPIIRATELLLQERIPPEVSATTQPPEGMRTGADVREIVPPVQRRAASAHTRYPFTHLLSNGRYGVMIDGAGSGYSRWRGQALTRWHEDVTGDSSGAYVYLRDVGSGDIWSAGYQPTRVEPDSYEVAFSEYRAEILRRDGTITTRLEVLVSPEDDAEVRRLTLTNLSSRTREIELTSYAEIVLAPDAADSAHPAFAKLFVVTEFVSHLGALIATRRPRAPEEPRIFAAHLVVIEGDQEGGLQFETDRARFLGRGRDARHPAAVADGWPLSDTVGTVIDPVFSLRCRLRLRGGATARIAFWTLVAPSREAVLGLIDKHHDPAAFERALTLSWTQAQVQLHYLDISADEANLFQLLANHVLFPLPNLRPTSEVIIRGAGAASTLWANGISGDLPIVLLRIEDADEIDIVRQLLRAHEYWRLKQLAVDLVIVNEKPGSYNQDFQAALEALGRARRFSPRAETAGRPGGVFILRADLVTPETHALLQSVARVVLLSRRGTLAEQLKRLLEPTFVPPPARPLPPRDAASPALPRPELEYFNGLGGFAEGGRDYVAILDDGRWTPAPWNNVIANEIFGFQASTEGSGDCWAVNSQQNHLTPWSNDPVTNPPSDIFYLRDTDSGLIWTPTAAPIRREGGVYLARHGQGFVRYEHLCDEIALDLLAFVPPDDPIKISRLTIHNRSGRTRRLSVTAYVEWVLGATRGAGAPFVITRIDAATQAMLAHNPWSAEFGSRVAFADLRGAQTGWTADRTEFIGRDGALDHPAALSAGAPLSGRVGAGLDPCAALQSAVVLRPGETAEIVLLLGQGADEEAARSLVQRYRAADLDAVLNAVTGFWNELLETVQVKTPDRALDILVNRWLLYQVLSCRVWARTGFYQSSGAYGFRDQLQDVMALCVVRPAIARAHILRAAGRQFIEGDVQHWWLPPSGRGIRTQISDDRLWLPYVVAHYVEVTGDRGVLDEEIPFLEGPPLKEGEHEAFFQPTVSEQTASLFEHCARAIDTSLAFGANGLPLFRTGDWNDGMNRVGIAGKGESVWLGWFLYATLLAGAALRSESARGDAWREQAATLRQALETAGWDGDWYRRGSFDDGTPLGSVQNDECRIDAIAQSWAVMSGGADKARGARAMAAVEQYLIHPDDGLHQLFTPPFDQSPLDPGYIKGYPPGIRENGGQYTHGVCWSILAFAALGEGDKAAELFALLNPINHALTPSAVQRYKVEPYVLCGDVYSVSPHVGRGGWSWYSGSAGWMYRAALEAILGFHLQGDTLRLTPCIPRGWPGFEIAFRYRTSRYAIAVTNPHGIGRGVAHVALDGASLPDPAAPIRLVDDGASHLISVVLGERENP